MTAVPPVPPDHLSRLQAALAGGYTMERELGGGGMSRVFVAMDHGLGRRVVIKVLLPELAASLSVERFRREVLLAAGLQHPNIVPVLTAGDVEGLPYFIMPFVDGESLRERMVRGPLSVRETVNVAKDVARAYGVLAPSGFASRWTFFIGADGRIAAIDRNVNAGSHGEDIVKKLAAVASQAVETPAVKERLAGLGATVVSKDRQTPEYLAKFLKSEIEKWAAPIKQSGASVD